MKKLVLFLILGALVGFNSMAQSSMFDYILAGTSAGGKILRSIDSGLTWSDLGSMGKGNPICFCRLDNGKTLYGTDQGWLINIEDGTSVRPTSNRIQSILQDSGMYNKLLYNKPVIYLGTDQGEELLSTDGGLTFTSIATSYSLGNIKQIIRKSPTAYHLIMSSNGIWQNHVPTEYLQELHPGNFTCGFNAGNYTIYAGTNDGHIWKSYNYGFSWNDLGQIGVNSAPIVSIEKNGNRFGLIKGMGSTASDQAFYFTDDDFVTTTRINLNLSNNEQPLCLMFIKNNTWIVGTGYSDGTGYGRILRSTDNGLSWTDIGEQYSQSSINCLISYSDTTLAPPTGPPIQTFCTADNPTFSNLTATGTLIKWYNSPTGGTALDPSIILTNGTTYYASQTIGGIESSGRLAVSVIVIPSPNQPSEFTTSSPTVTQGQTGVIYAVLNDSTVTYAWSFSGTGAIITGSSNSTSVDFSNDATSGTLSVTASNSCSTSAARTIDITVNPIGNPQTGNFILAGTSPDGLILKSIDNGLTWANEGTASKGNPSCFCKLTNGDILYGTDQGYIVNNTKGTSVKVSDNGITALASNGFLIFCGDNSGNCYLSSDNSLSYSLYLNISSTTPGINAILFDGENPLLFTYSGIYNYLGTKILSGTFWSALDAGDGYFYTGAAWGYVWRNTNANDYSSWTNLGIASFRESIESMIKANNGRIIINSGIAIYYSDNGFATTIKTKSYFSSKLIYINNDIVLTGGNNIYYGILRRSTDNGENWSDLGQQYSQTGINCFISIGETSPMAPTGPFTQTFCAINNPTISNLTATGTSIKWHNSPTGGTALGPSVVLTDGTTYYASQTVGGIESSSRLAVSVIVTPSPNQPSEFTTSSPTVTQGQTGVVYTVPNDSTITYAWSYNGTGTTITGSSNSVSVDFSNDATNGTLSVTASNSCSTSAARTIDIAVNPPLPTPLETDSLALVALYNATNGPGWIHKDNWLTGPLYTWYGVIVNNGRVTVLVLERNQLNGQFPEQFGNLTALQELYLNNNQLSGQIPELFGNLTALQVLYLDDNQLSGQIPEQLGNLTALIDLALYNNQLSGQVPEQLGNLTALQDLDLSGNQLSGALPSTIGNLIHLYYLEIGNNQFSGAIPATIGNLSNLQYLFLYNNQFSGDLTPIGNLSKLFRLDVSNNQFTSLPQLPLPLQAAQIQNNLLTFDDIVPNISHIQYYSPQGKVGSTETIHVTNGNTFTIDLGIDALLTTNIYNWYKNGKIYRTTTVNKLVINNVTSSDAGVYTCAITNSLVPDLTLTSNPQTLIVEGIQITTQPVNVTQCAGTKATFSVIAKGTGLKYQWRKDGTNITGAKSTSYTINNISFTNAGSYDVVITDASSHSATSDAAVLTVNPLPAASISPVAPKVCAGSGQAMTAMVTSGTMPYTHLWTGAGVIFLDNIYVPNPVFTSNIPGTHSLTYTVTDINGCMGTSNAKVTVNAVPTINLGTNPAICSGVTRASLLYNETTGNPNQFSIVYDAASISAGFKNVTNGSLPNGAITLIIPATATPAIYSGTLVIKNNSANCPSTPYYFSITINPKPKANISPKPASVCAGNNLSLNGNPSGGTQPYMHVWTVSGAGNLDNTSIVNPELINTVAGKFLLNYTVTDINGCAANSSITATVNPVPALFLGTNPSVCIGLSNTSLSYSGATGNPNQYSIVYDETAIIAGFKNVTNGSLPKGAISILIPKTATSATYYGTLTIRNNAASCSSVPYNFSFTINPKPNTNITPNPAIACQGIALSMNGNPSGGSLPYTQVWTGTGAGFLNNHNIVNPELTTNAVGNFPLTFTVTDINGCTGTSNITVTVNALPNINLGAPPAICMGATKATLSYSGAIGKPNQYNIEFDANALTAGFKNVTNVSLPAAAISITVPATAMPRVYSATLTVRNSTSGCPSRSYPFIIIINPKPNVNITPRPASICAGATLILNGNPVGGITPYTSMWTGAGSIFLDNVTSPTPNFTYDKAGIYPLTYTATDKNGCTASANSAVTVHAEPSVSLGSNPVINAGITRATLPYSGAIGSPNQYSIVFDQNATAKGFKNITNAVLPAGTFSIIVPLPAIPATYNGVLTVRNSTYGCYSIPYNFSITIINPLFVHTEPIVNDNQYEYDSTKLLSTKVNVDENLLLNELNIFPNPTNGTITLIYSGANDQHVNILIFGTLGNILMQFPLKVNDGGLVSQDIDLSKLKKGIYCLVLIDRDKRFMKNVVVN